ncbi:hypothetical protein K3G39_05875 [Pontibacter sp. HSC-14F20]|uniref:hypothetical protein n=1 Tax=Pontibacter sp. HSC-14F20 TaxID=2864136 RepID=UPI001C72D328|nr:hypothetical protein [Pontibacter sp. HSC-14F20]MBX0332759.1 hypothetical protein [Pontibacter sp. HSC-14F20]
MTEPDKTLNEALFRSHQATDKDNQAQSKLYNMSTGQQNEEQHDNARPKLHETPRNLLQSWDTLRQMDMDLAEKKPDHDRKP